MHEESNTVAVIPSVAVGALSTLQIDTQFRASKRVKERAELLAARGKKY
jgi:hypothetical protein